MYERVNKAPNLPDNRRLAFPAGVSSGLRLECAMSKFTPGPWSAKVDETATIRDAQGNQLGIMTHLKTKFGGRRDSDEVAANTKLAADAPALLDALEKAVAHIERNTCLHEETYRGGAIWEICHQCGAKWADDEGGKPEFKWPEHVEQARALIAKHGGGV